MRRSSRQLMRRSSISCDCSWRTLVASQASMCIATQACAVVVEHALDGRQHRRRVGLAAGEEGGADRRRGAACPRCRPACARRRRRRGCSRFCASASRRRPAPARRDAGERAPAVAPREAGIGAQRGQQRVHRRIALLGRRRQAAQQHLVQPARQAARRRQLAQLAGRGRCDRARRWSRRRRETARRAPRRATGRS